MTKFIIPAVLSLALVGVAAPSQAQHRSGGGGGGGSRGGGAVGGGVAVPRGSVGSRGAVVVGPRGGFVGRPFFGRPFVYGPGFASFGFYAGYPYYYPYAYPYGYAGYYGYPYYPYGAGYGGGYAVAEGLSTSYGRVRISDAPEHAAVYADGYYVGTVDDFNGTFQHLDLEPGAHHIEIRPQGQPPISFDVNVQAGETITYHAR
jgi:hypothetical protein